ncbi:MAG: hypothetical protein QOJ69_148 [Actinomycetota bacterium]|nr:hypothetical protein [Actinomycetota bacterium]
MIVCKTCKVPFEPGAQFCASCGGFVDYVGAKEGESAAGVPSGGTGGAGGPDVLRGDTEQQAFAASAADESEQRAIAEAEAKEREESEARARASAAATAEATARAKAQVETDADAKAKAENEAKLQAAAKAKAEAEAAAAAKAAESSRRAAAMIAKPAPRPRPPSTPVAPQPVATAPADPKPAVAPKWPPPTAAAPQPGELTCGQCGTGNPSSRTFCRQCGAPLGQPAPPPVVPPPPRNSRGLLKKLKLPLVFLAALVVIGGGAFLLTRGGGDGGGGGSADGGSTESTVDGNQPPTEPVSKQVTVDSTRSFVDTGIVLAVGDEVQIAATGRSFHGGGGGSSGPEGDSDPGLRQFNVIADTNHNALIAKIGQSGKPFIVGAKLTFTAEEAGPLILGVNDTGVNNNSGAYAATITVGGG